MRRPLQRRNMVAADFPVGVDDQGRKLCRWCHGVIPPHRRTLCSDACGDEISIRTNPSYMRTMVAKRDHGVCAECGLDTDRAYGALLLAERFTFAQPTPGGWRAGEIHPWWWRVRKALLLSAELSGFIDSRGHRWEADHLVAVEDGGRGCGLEGLRTLCLKCHKLRTAIQARARAARRKNAVQMR